MVLVWFSRGMLGMYIYLRLRSGPGPLKKLHMQLTFWGAQLTPEPFQNCVACLLHALRMRYVRDWLCAFGNGRGLRAWCGTRVYVLVVK